MEGTEEVRQGGDGERERDLEGGGKGGRRSDGRKQERVFKTWSASQASCNITGHSFLNMSAIGLWRTEGIE